MRDVELNIGTKTRAGVQLGTVQIIEALQRLYLNVRVRWVEGEDEGTAVVCARLPFGAQPIQQVRRLCEALDQTAIAAWFAPCHTQPRGYGTVIYRDQDAEYAEAYGRYDPNRFTHYLQTM